MGCVIEKAVEFHSSIQDLVELLTEGNVDVVHFDQIRYQDTVASVSHD